MSHFPRTVEQPVVKEAAASTGKGSYGLLLWSPQSVGFRATDLSQPTAAVVNPLVNLVAIECSLPPDMHNRDQPATRKLVDAAG